MRPLYQMSSAASPKTLEPAGNLGLWYDKFYDQWEGSGAPALKNLAPQKVRWIKQAVEWNAHRSPEQRALSDELIDRLITLVQATKGLFLVFETTSPLITGLGQGHPIENGFTWHPLLGAPYIPGTTLKGQLKAWPQWSGEAATELLNVLDRVTILDSLPIFPVKLQGEVMTPHYTQYYREGSPPGDYESPVPIPFLTVSPGQRFLLAALGHNEDLQVLQKYWETSLDSMGIGAKTSSGFGRLQRNKSQENAWRSTMEQTAREAEQQRQLAQLLPWEREMWADGYQEDAEKFMQRLGEKWLARMDSAEEPDRAQIAIRLRQWYLNNKPDQWRKPNKKNAEKIRRIQQHLPAERV